MHKLLKLFLVICFIPCFVWVWAQEDTTTATRNTIANTETKTRPVKDSLLKASLWPIWELQRRANDHVMLQVGYFMWLNQPNNVVPKGMPNTVNLYAMYDFAFRSNPRFSVALGLGVTWNHMYFAANSRVIDYSNPAARTDPFSDLSGQNHFKINRLTQFYINVPAIEFRFVSNPKNTNKAFKASIGGSYGWMVFSQTIGKNLLDANGNSINDITQKYVSTRFFTTGRVLLTARVGWGPVSAFVTYQPTSIFTATGPNVQSFSVGISLGGL